jgi:hypothetical protein
MKAVLVTALFDINRDIKGDGRRIEEYLEWFSKTLKIQCDMFIYTEKKFYDFINFIRKDIPKKTEIIIQNLKDLSLYKDINRMSNIMNNYRYKTKIRDPNRIECYLPEYNLIQYSKFEWLENTIFLSEKEGEKYDFFFWIDAGCSRFFLDTDIAKEWPNFELFEKDKFLIQRNTNFEYMWNNLKINEYLWDNRSFLVGTLFGGSSENIKVIKGKVLDVYKNYFLQNNCINNEQIALGIVAKENLNLFNIIPQKLYNEKEGSSHLPLFKRISYDYIKGENE